MSRRHPPMPAAAYTETAFEQLIVRESVEQGGWRAFARYLALRLG